MKTCHECGRETDAGYVELVPNPGGRGDLLIWVCRECWEDDL